MIQNRLCACLATIVFILFSNGGFISAQQKDLAKSAKELSLNLGKSEQRKVEKVYALMADAANILEQTTNISDKNKALAQFRLSSDKCISAFDILNNLYGSVVEEFYDKSNRIYINKFDHARYYDQKVDAYLLVAKRILLRRDSVKNNVEEYGKLSVNAYDAFTIAMLDQLRAMKIYQDFPIEYPYDWDDFFKERQILLAREEAEKSAKNKDYKVEKQEVAKESFKMIYFRVQIAAHTVQISESQMKPIYSGKLAVTETKDGEWYKYTIGNFEHYDQALELLKICGVRKAFIVAYDSQNVRQDLKSIIKDPKQ